MPGVRFSAEQKAKAVRLVAEATPQHESEWAAIVSVAGKIGAVSRLRVLVAAPAP